LLGDAGQAFPIYITVVGGLLFLAFAYLAVGQAAANRNGSQTAADAAALAAAQDTRDQLAAKWVQEVLDPVLWRDIFNGNASGLTSSCGRATQLAGQNDAHLDSCAAYGLLGYRVVVTNNKSAGESIVPVTSHKHARTSAIAVIEPLCTFKPLPDGAGDDILPRLTCKGGNWDLDPKHITDLPDPEDLFAVHLTD
jgi:hypothetical protein